MLKPSTFSDVNMTPLVDVMLVVLVLFMITSPLLLPGPEVTLPATPAALSPVLDPNTVLTVTRSGRIYYREQDITGRVTETLRTDPALREHGQLYVRGDRDVAYGLVAEAMSEARAASVEQLNLVVDPEPRGEDLDRTFRANTTKEEVATKEEEGEAAQQDDQDESEHEAP